MLYVLISLKSAVPSVCSRWPSLMQMAAKQMPNKRRKLAEGCDPAWTLSQLKAAGVISPLLAKNLLDSIDVSDQSSLVRALMLRDKILLAVANVEYSALTAILKSAAQIEVSRRVLELSGLPHFLRDLSLWRKSPKSGDELLASAIRQKWQKALASSEKLQPLHSQGFPMWRGFRALAFAEKVSLLTEELFKATKVPLSIQSLREVATVLLINGFETIRQLDGVSRFDVEQLFLLPAHRTAVSQAISVAAADYVPCRVPMQSFEEKLELATGSAAIFAEKIASSVIGILEKNNDTLAIEFGVTPETAKVKPTTAIKELAQAKRAGSGVDQLLEDKVQLLLIESSRASLPSVCSALRAWHAFATEVLTYPANATLPPDCDDHVLMFLTIFRSPKTAANYVNAIVWICTVVPFNMNWRTSRVTKALVGVKKKSIRIFGLAIKLSLIMATPLLLQLVELAQTLKWSPSFITMAVVAWWFLLRLPSELPALTKGRVEHLYKLPPDVAGSIWVHDGQAQLRLRKRKHKPSGSWLQRPCVCSVSPSICPVHVVEQHLSQYEHEQLVFDIGIHEFMFMLRRGLALLGVPHAHQYTTKCFRAGHANEMAKRGFTLGFIMQMGEWKSRAVLSYIDEEAVEQNTFLSRALDAESDDDG